ncbi:MAG: hypothetical protein JW384_01582 [Nitrosomonadaceae bacterium]|nr:hypothetical protein [Nitrosomonadaceae bacterium]
MDEATIPTLLAQATVMLDKAIASCSGRGLVTSAEMVDMLLDLRILIDGAQRNALALSE